jgi:WD40 repeat protein
MQDSNLDSLSLIEKNKEDENFKNIRSLQGHIDPASCVAVLQSGDIMSGSWDKTLKEWDK